MSKRELDNLKQRIGEIAVNIKEQEAFAIQLEDHFSKVYQKRQVLHHKYLFKPHERVDGKKNCPLCI